MYLLLQAGVDASVCGSLAQDDSYAHEWTMIKLNGSWYHADVTWRIQQPYSLRYFLNTDTMRDWDGLNISILNVGEINELWHKDLQMDDGRYEELWDVRWYCVDHAAQCIECYTDIDFDYLDLSLYERERSRISGV